MEYKMTDTEVISNFVYGGKATFTIRSLSSGKHWTFYVSKKDKVHFVRLNIGDSSIYIGYIAGEMRYNPSMKAPNSAPHVVIQHLLKYIAEGELHPKFEFFHVGKCGRCGRPLTDPISIERGLGPHCASLQ